MFGSRKTRSFQSSRIDPRDQTDGLVGSGLRIRTPVTIVWMETAVIAIPHEPQSFLRHSSCSESQDAGEPTTGLRCAIDCQVVAIDFGDAVVEPHLFDVCVKPKRLRRQISDVWNGAWRVGDES